MVVRTPMIASEGKGQSEDEGGGGGGRGRVELLGEEGSLGEVRRKEGGRGEEGGMEEE